MANTIAIFHLEAKVITRSVGRSAVAASAYMSCSKVYNDYDGIQHDYTRKRGLVWQRVFLPVMAPDAWKDREALWNAVEETEKSKDSRLAREFNVALPTELNEQENVALLKDYLQTYFVAEGMCVDVSIHDTDGHNPHAHILFTVRPLNTDGSWQYKTQKEYLCVRGDEERGFTAAEFASAQDDGWEKQYLYTVGKKKVYMTPSAAKAHGYKRASKYPKSTKFGRQNPITEKWNSETQLVSWRAAWADTVNLYFEKANISERITHLSFDAQGKTEQPTIHEGVAARRMEQKGFVSDRCELNRQIRADNDTLHELQATIAKLEQSTNMTIAEMAKTIEKLRQQIFILCYKIGYAQKGQRVLNERLDVQLEFIKQYDTVDGKIKSLGKCHKELLAKLDTTHILNIVKRKSLMQQITTVIEDREELKTEKSVMLQELRSSGIDDIKTLRHNIAETEATVARLADSEQKSASARDEAASQVKSMMGQADELDATMLTSSREALRPSLMSAAHEQLCQNYGKHFDETLARKAEKFVYCMLNENDLTTVSVTEQLHDAEKQKQERTRAKNTPSRPEW